MKLLSTLLMVGMLTASLALAHPPAKPGKSKPAKLPRVEKHAEPLRPAPVPQAKRPGKAMQMEETRIETAPEQAQKPVEAKQAPERNSLIQSKKDMRGAILRSGGGQ